MTKEQRKVYLRQIRRVFQAYGFDLHVGFAARDVLAYKLTLDQKAVPVPWGERFRLAPCCKHVLARIGDGSTN